MAPHAIDRVAGEVLADLAVPGRRGVVVDSPPGAGKSTLVVRATADLAAAGEAVMLIAQTNEQVDDLADRLAVEAPALRIGRLSRHHYVPSLRVAKHTTVSVEDRIDDLADCAVVIGTAAKWATVADGRWPVAICDEAYQMRSDKLLRIANRFQRALFVGDPGQLDPFSTIDIGRWTGLTWDPTQSAVAVLLTHNPDLPVHRLPVSWRLPHTAAPVIAEAFYPFVGFRSGTGPSERRLSLTTRAFHSNPIDQAIEMAAATGWAFYELPARHTLRTDTEATSACAALAQRILQRGVIAHSEREPHGRTVSANRIAIGTAHRDQAAAIRSMLTPGCESVTVDTANRLQGREYDMTIVLHPLSGRRDATQFHLEAGRLCVLTSRHRHACIVVGRAGIPELLDAHPSTEPIHLNVEAKFPDGWEANHAILAHLANHRVRIR